MQVNNETGVINDIRRIHELIGGRALLHADGVQGYLRVPFDMKFCDLYTLSGHKIHGPKGSAHWCSKAVCASLPGPSAAVRRTTCAPAQKHPRHRGVTRGGAAHGGYDMGALMETKLHLIAAFRAAVPERR
jgi:hypothetical protein